MSPLEVLGLQPSATEKEIKSAYRKLAKRWHPDICKEPKAEQMFKQVQMAFEKLTGKYVEPKPPTPQPRPSVVNMVDIWNVYGSFTYSDTNNVTSSGTTAGWSSG